MTTVLDITADRRLLRGRGALSNAVGRFEKQTRTLIDDGWSSGQGTWPSTIPPHRATELKTDDGWRDEDGTPPPLRTEVIRDATRTIITRNNSPDISFDRSINPYRGCEHGCIYCFARPTHAYLGMSPGADFESRLFAKPNAAELLAKELSAPGYVPKVIAIGTNTDPYQPIEKKMRIMRSILEVLRDFKHPVGIVTKSPLVLRDIDILCGDGARGSGEGRALRHHARPQAGAHDGAARRHAAAAFAGDPCAERGGHSNGRHVRAGHPRAERRRDGIDSLRRRRLPARARPAMCFCACRSRSRTCSANGSRPMSRTAPGMSCR